MAEKQKDLDFRTVEAYNAMYAGVPKSKTLLRIWHDVYGDDYPEEVEPFSFVTKTDLARIVQYLTITAIIRRNGGSNNISEGGDQYVSGREQSYPAALV